MVHISVPKQALGWFPLCLGLVVKINQVTMLKSDMGDGNVWCLVGN